MSNEEMVTKKNGNGKLRPLPIVEQVAEQPAQPDVRKIPEQALATVRLLTQRAQAGYAQLGIIDFEKAKLEAQAAQLRAKIAQDAGEADAILNQAAKELGVDNTWMLDPQAGAFVKKTQ